MLRGATDKLRFVLLAIVIHAFTLDGGANDVLAAAIAAAGYAHGRGTAKAGRLVSQ